MPDSMCLVSSLIRMFYSFAVCYGRNSFLKDSDNCHVSFGQKVQHEPLEMDV